MTDYIYGTFIITVLIVICYKVSVAIQDKYNYALLNPMVITMALMIPLLLLLNINIEQFKTHTELLNALLEPAIVALGLPLYQQIQTIKKNIGKILTILSVSITFVITISYYLALLIIQDMDISISIALKSITTPIGLALTDKLGGIDSLTALMITIAGISGAILGTKWLNFIKIKCPYAQGLAIGCASHALGTSTISKISNKHAAFGSLAIVFSAIITAIIAPILLPLIDNSLR